MEPAAAGERGAWGGGQLVLSDGPCPAPGSGGSRAQPRLACTRPPKPLGGWGPGGIPGGGGGKQGEKKN